jgi:glycosyltransferase involved in cell wall biosynthesis
MKTLYICYFGLREPLVQTQVLPYLREIRDGGIDVSLLTFEPKKYAFSPADAERQRLQLRSEGISWYSIPYHKRPTLPATVYDILAGAWLVSRLARRHKIDVLHARAHIAAAIGALAKLFSGARLLFDVRGLLPEEYVDAGLWPRDGYLYRLAKAAERRFFAAADAFVVLTERARGLLFQAHSDTDDLGRPVEVIPCCVDSERFHAANFLSKDGLRNELHLEGRRVIVYVGALGGWYLTDEMAEFLAVAHEQDSSTFSMVLTQTDPAIMGARFERVGIEEKDYLIRQVPPEDVPRYLKAADIALAFIKPCFSKLASSPTKIAEYLAGGLPVVINSGIGDLDELLRTDQVGVSIKECQREEYQRALREIELLRQDESLPLRCRASARNRFDLKTVGGQRYRRIYRRLLDSGEGS